MNAHNYVARLTNEYIFILLFSQNRDVDSNILLLSLWPTLFCDFWSRRKSFCLEYLF